MLGLVGVIVTSLPSFSLGGSPAAAPSEATTSQPDAGAAGNQPAGSAAPAASDTDIGFTDRGSPGPDATDVRQLSASGAPEVAGDSRTAVEPGPTRAAGAPPADTLAHPAIEPNPASAIRLMSVVALLVGLGILAVSTLRIRSRRGR
jgi:hypothetical protein